MKKYFYLKGLILLSLMLTTANLKSQVTIGSTTDPNPKAILDLVSSDKGLLIPRVALTSSNASSSGYIAGMMVYNTATVTGDLTPGFYLSNGTKWIKVADSSVMPSGAWIYCPPFVLPWTSGGAKTFDIFDHYKKSLEGFGTSPKVRSAGSSVTQVADLVTSASNFEYVITNLPAACFSGNVTINASGVISYTCSTTAPDPNKDFMTIILIKK